MNKSFLCVGIAILLSDVSRSEGLIKETETGIASESVRHYQDGKTYPLPLAAHWTAGVWPEARGWRPEFQIDLIRRGHYLLPWFQMPLPDGWRGPESGMLSEDYYRKSIEACRDARLPISFISTEWEILFGEPEIMGLPPEENPNVISLEGQVIPESDPMGPVEQWREVGRKWTDNERMKKLQELYPDPPLVLLISNNERARLMWTAVERSKRWMDKYGAGKDAEFKRKVISDGWIERFRAMQEGMREGLVNETWKKNVKFIAYDAFGPVFLGRWPGWVDYSLYTPGRLNPYTQMWDGGSPSYYTSNWNESTDFRVYSPQIESMSWVFQVRDAYEKNPRFWFELSIWDGYMGGTARPVGDDDKRTVYRKLGQEYTPERYAGFVQFGMWLLRPQLLREFRMHDHPWEEGKDYFMAMVEAVDRVHKTPQLRGWWQEGELVPNPSGIHPNQVDIPEEFKKEQRWFLLDADCNPKGPLTPELEIPVFALALTKGKSPERQWLIYAHAPLGERKDVSLTLPKYGKVKVDVSVGGSFYELNEKDKSIKPISGEVEKDQQVRQN